jgi:hypothetical protein
MRAKTEVLRGSGAPAGAAIGPEIRRGPRGAIDGRACARPRVRALIGVIRGPPRR